ncbi:hypothetical protein UA08_00829 [Talaromyces atroroseus]|uniref:Zn(2)-C6 fungal-type domain-containing protein n=1 Tax=Talaromyces atroroseus TaxID=1441469 RepID=A0A225AQW7_TALAT|nr:hypothetical protein UA08_00829 [Talaromyces atroroseus]OKL64002.1 hypothetical protein UA08_00829 [Talaromyces atroroseus]
MPNTGRPSRDCYSCRRRRIRCDLKRPACTQCLNKQQPCPGYRDELDLRFRVETVSLQNAAHPKRGHLISLNDETQSRRPEEQAARSHPTLQRPLPEMWNNHALPFLLSKFQRKFAESVYSVVAFVISHVEEGSVLFKVCSAVGLAYMANITRSLQAIAEREQAYGAAISAVNVLLKDPQQWQSDRILLSVWLLGQCEHSSLIMDL